MSDKYVAVYSDSTDPLIRVLEDIGVLALHVDELLAHITKAEWPILISTSYTPAIIQLFDRKTVFNRVFSFNNTEFGHRLEEWGYPYAWGHVALRSLYLHAKSLIHDTGERGVSKCMLPLNTQWWAMSDRGGFAVPKFLYAFGTTEPDLTGFADPIRKSIWSIHEWGGEASLSGPEGVWHPFYVERPAGTPVMCSFLGSDVRLAFPRGSIGVPIEKFVELARIARNIFCSEIGEILTFVEGNGTIRFYAFSPTMSSFVDQPDFEERLSSFMRTEIEGVALDSWSPQADEKSCNLALA